MRFRSVRGSPSADKRFIGRRFLATLIGMVVSAVAYGCESPRTFDPESESWKHTETLHAQRAGAALDEETEALIRKIESALTLRAEMIRFAGFLKQKLRDHAALSGAELARLNRGTVKYLALRQELLDVAHAHESWVHAPDERMRDQGINPERRLQGVMMSLAAALVLYDNYLLAISIYQKDRQLRRVLNTRDEGYRIASNALQKVTLSYNSAANRQRVRDALRFYESYRPALMPALRSHPDVVYLDSLIRSSPSYALVHDADPLRGAARSVLFYQAMIRDLGLRLRDEGTQQTSGVFGNVVGIVETRRGYMNRDATIASKLKHALQPGDILLEKTPFRLTDKLIPGYWGHVAIWIGNESELRTLGIWDHPVVREHHSAIREERLVVEALRSGVQMNTLERFLNIDDLAVLRDPKVDSDPELLQGRLLRTLRQVGKRYDFNFDVETRDRIICSELCYVAMTDIDWRTENALGRATISPDRIAARALEGRLDVVLLYHRAEPIDGDCRAYMDGLMK